MQQDFLCWFVVVFGRVVVATAPLPAGVNLSQEQLAMADIDIAAEPGAVFTDPAQLIGRTLARPLGAAEAVRAPALKSRQWFAAGETVQVLAVGAGFSVASEAQAMSAGIEGQDVRVRFESGRVGKCASIIDCLQPYYFHVHLAGSEGSILDNRFTSTRLHGLRRDRWSTLETALVDSGDVKDHPYQPQFQAFVESTLEGRPMPDSNFQAAFETHRVIFAADLSAAAGRPVKLSEFAL